MRRRIPLAVGLALFAQPLLPHGAAAQSVPSIIRPSGAIELRPNRLTITPLAADTVTSLGANQALGLNVNETGGLTGTSAAFAANGIFINDYANGDPSINGATGLGFAIIHNAGYNGTSRFQGSRAALYANFNQYAHNAIQSQATTEYVAGLFYITANAAECLSSCALTYTASIGAIYGFNARAILNNGALWFTNLTGGEVDVAAAAGSSVWLKTGLQLSEDAVDAVAGTVEAMILIGSEVNPVSQGGAVAPGFKNGILFGSVSPNSYTPMNAAGTLIATSGAWSIANALDVSSVTVTGCVVKIAAGCQLDGAGDGLIRGYLNVIGSFAYVSFNDSIGAYPAPGNGLAIGWNVTNANGEVDFWDTFTGALGYNSFYFYQQTGAATKTLVASLGLSGAQITSSLIVYASAYPVIDWNATSNGTDIKRWHSFVDPSGTFYLGVENDAASTFASAISFTRAGATIGLAIISEPLIVEATSRLIGSESASARRPSIPSSVPMRRGWSGWSAILPIIPCKS